MSAPRLAALAGLIAATALVVLIVAGSGSSYRVTGVFADVRGLIAGGAVKAGGVQVGKVSDIRFGADGLPRVRMTIDTAFRLRRSAFANIRLGSNAGGLNRYVDLQQGTGPELPDGAVLGPRQTDSPVNLDQALSDLDPKTRADAGLILAAVDHATRDRGRYLAASLRYSGRSLAQTAELLAQVGADGAALRTLVLDGRRVVGALAASPADLGRSADHLAALLTLSARRQHELAATAALLGPGMAAAHGALDRLAGSIPHLRELIATARPVLSQVGPTVRVLRPATDAAAPLLREVRALVAAAPAQLNALRPAIAAANRMFPLLAPALAGLGPLLDELRVHAPELIGFFTLGADATSDYDANGNVVRVSPVQIESARHTNLVGASSGAPGLLARPFIRTPGALEGDPWTGYRASFIGSGR